MWSGTRSPSSLLRSVKPSLRTGLRTYNTGGKSSQTTFFTHGQARGGGSVYPWRFALSDPALFTIPDEPDGVSAK